MKILVLGSAGQIGAYLTDHFKTKGHTVYTIDIVDGEDQDLRDETNHVINKNFVDIDFVFFLAFDVGGSRYLSKYQHTFEFIDNNARIMLNVFGQLALHKTPFIFASSQMSNMTYSPYGIMKAVGEIYTKALKGRIVKFWNVYGIEHDLEKSHVITDFILKAKNTGTIDMMTDGEEEREFLYAEDCCNALEQVMLNYNEFDEDTELHITSFESTKVIDIANIIADHYGASILPSEKKDMVQMNKKNIANTTILQYWQPVIDIKTGINRVIRSMDNE
jgi:nucleoside-diphosphate-sugar epimerase